MGPRGPEKARGVLCFVFGLFVGLGLSKVWKHMRFLKESVMIERPERMSRKEEEEKRVYDLKTLLDMRLDREPCPFDFTVYVYEYPNMHSMDWYQAASRMKKECLEKEKCTNHYNGEHLLAQFSLELILHDFFLQSCVRTMNPEAADFFFVPFYGDLAYREANRPDAPSLYEEALLSIIEDFNLKPWEDVFQTTGKYWLRRKGADHILVQAAPVTGLRHLKGRRGWHHYMQQLTNPIWLSLELSRSFVYEYPACSSKNIILPYPIPGKHWISSSNLTSSWEAKSMRLLHNYPQKHIKDLEKKKPLFAYCHAGNHGCPEVRKAIKKEFQFYNQSPFMVLTSTTKKKNNNFHIPQRTPRQALMHLSRFCPCPEGDSPSAKRQYDAVLAGCIPVLISDDALYAFEYPHFGDLSHQEYALRFSEAKALNQSLIPWLRALSPQKVSTLSKNLARISNAFRYYKSKSDTSGHDPLLDARFPDGGALALLLNELRKRLGYNRTQACSFEREKAHFYLGKQYCGDVPYTTELKRLNNQLKRASSAAAHLRKEGDARGKPSDINQDAQLRVARIQRAIQAYENGRIL